MSTQAWKDGKHPSERKSKSEEGEERRPAWHDGGVRRNCKPPTEAGCDPPFIIRRRSREGAEMHQEQISVEGGRGRDIRGLGTVRDVRGLVSSTSLCI